MMQLATMGVWPTCGVAEKKLSFYFACWCIETANELAIFAPQEGEVESPRPVCVTLDRWRLISVRRHFCDNFAQMAVFCTDWPGPVRLAAPIASVSHESTGVT